MTNANTVCLDVLGYDKRYILNKQGQITNTKTNRLMRMYKHNYKLLGLDGYYHTVSLKTIYRQCFNIEYCIDNISNLPNEEWRQMVNDKDIDTSAYLISNMGRVKSLKGYNAIILKQAINKYGYYIVSIDGKNLRVHRLVALAFIPNDDRTKDTVDHINGNKADNRASNLQWLSLIDNIRKEWKDRKQDNERIKSNTTQSL